MRRGTAAGPPSQGVWRVCGGGTAAGPPSPAPQMGGDVLRGPSRGPAGRLFRGLRGDPGFSQPAAPAHGCWPLAVRSEGARPPAHLCSVAGTDQWATRLHPEGEGWKVQTRCHSHPADPPQCPQARGPVLDGRKGTSPGLSLLWAWSPRRPAQRRAGGSVSFAGVGRVDRVWAGWPGGCDLGATLLSEALHMGRPWGTTRGVSK